MSKQQEIPSTNELLQGKCGKLRNLLSNKEIRLAVIRKLIGFNWAGQSQQDEVAKVLCDELDHSTMEDCPDYVRDVALILVTLARRDAKLLDRIDNYLRREYVKLGNGGLLKLKVN